MPPRRSPILVSLCALALALLATGATCGNPEKPTLVAPLDGAALPASGVLDVEITFASTLSAVSQVRVEITPLDLAPLETLDVSHRFLPAGQSDFAGADAASARLTALDGLLGGRTLLNVRVDADGNGSSGLASAIVHWSGATACEATAGHAAGACLAIAADATRACYLGTGRACAPGDAQIDAALADLATSVAAACADDATVQAAGYGAALTLPALVERLAGSCTGQAEQLARRAFGGPHGKVLEQVQTGALGGDASCLETAYLETADYLGQRFQAQRACVLDDAGCATPAVDAAIAAAGSAATAAIDAACITAPVDALTGSDAGALLARAARQGDCLLAASHGDTAPLSLRCGPAAASHGVSVVRTHPAGLTPFAPGVDTQIALDRSVWDGARCGDDGDLAIWVRLPADPANLDKLLFYLQGGGFCFGPQCIGVSASRLDGLADVPPGSGILSSNPAVSPLSDWTRVWVPYCTQDVYAGGGVADVIITGSLTIQRHGAVNVRAALEVTRNILWEQLDASSPAGYRPDAMTVVFTGNSAGGFGSLYNLHLPIDELRWENTVTVPGAGLAMDNGEGLGVIGVGSLAQLFWNSRPFQPPYCNAPECAEGGALSAAHSERLLATPVQQLLQLSNQGDTTQRSTTLFDTQAQWINAVRQSYCANQGLPGLHYFLSSSTSSHHSIMLSSFDDLSVDGVDLFETLDLAVNDPALLVDRVSEGSLVSSFPGVLPFACPVSP